MDEWLGFRTGSKEVRVQFCGKWRFSLECFNYFFHLFYRMLFQLRCHLFV